MVKVIGYELKKGSFTSDKTGEQIDYDNVMLHTITDQYKNIVGSGSSVLKIKSSEFEKITGLKTPDALLDKEVRLDYIPVGNSVQLSSLRVVD